MFVLLPEAAKAGPCVYDVISHSLPTLSSCKHIEATFHRRPFPPLGGVHEYDAANKLHDSVYAKRRLKKRVYFYTKKTFKGSDDLESDVFG